MSLCRGKMKSELRILLRAREVTGNGRRYQDKHLFPLPHMPMPEPVST